MIKTSIEKLAESIGFDIAHSDDHVQADLLNGLSKGFKTVNEHSLSMQLSYMSNRFSKDTDNLILELAEFIKLKNK
jgi:hypothetical protein